MGHFAVVHVVLLNYITERGKYYRYTKQMLHEKGTKSILSFAHVEETVGKFK